MWDVCLPMEMIGINYKHQEEHRTSSEWDQRLCWAGLAGLREVSTLGREQQKLRLRGRGTQGPGKKPELVKQRSVQEGPEGEDKTLSGGQYTQS